MATLEYKGQGLLSELLMAHFQRPTSRSFARFAKAFRAAEVGVVATGAPEGVKEFVSTREQPVSVGMTSHGGQDGLVLTFADPVVFARNYGQKFNAGMQGEQVLGAVLLNPACRGILVNCAVAEVSIVISRREVERLRRPWWRVW